VKKQRFSLKLAENHYFSMILSQILAFFDKTQILDG